uniref:Ciliosis and planar polarity effector complex subunit 1 n=1 Tax=Coturnix japonica TaxID=93934 RepID=A0A8C2T5G2_COTJA
MEIKLDVLVSTSIKQRKPWTRITWIGQEKEAVFLLDDKHINEINLASGKTKKKIPQLQSLLKNVVVLTTSINGAWLAGLLTTGELFLWNKDQDCLKVIPAIDESRKITACLMRLYLYVSGDGRRVLLTTPTACVFLWESTEYTNTLSYKNSSGRWTQILPSESIMLPSTEEKEIGVHASFIQNEVLGDCCLCSFVFYSGECLVLTFLILRWHENGFKFASSLPYQIHWVQQTCSLVNLVPQCVSIKSRGALLSAFARDGLFLAVAVNQIDPKATQILFLNTLNFLTVSGSVKGCSSKSNTVPSKFIRSYWVGDMSWTPDSLFLACMLKRGSLILLTGMGELLTLITSGCSVEFGPAEFIPIHPLITYRQHSTLCQDSSQTLGSSASESDIMRQRFSVASHSRLPYLIVSDGFMITVLRFHNNVSPVGFLRSLLLDSTQRLETVRRNLMNSQSKGRHLCLRSLLSLKDSLLKHTQNHTSNSFSVPKFLEEDTTERNQKTTDLLVCNHVFPFPILQRVLSSVGKADQGHIEFASMFDTIHAEDDTEEKDKLSVELNSVQRSLLTAWQIGISKNIEERDTFLNYTVSCISHFFNILQFVECSSLYQDAFLNKSVKNSHWIHCVLRYFKLCLSVLHWHSRAGMTGHVAKLTLQTLKLMLVQKQDQLFSKNLLACFCLLKMVSHTLSSTCIPQYENLFVPGVNSLVELDSFIVPILLFLDESATQEFSSLKSLLRKPPQALNCDEKTEKRLIVLWRFLYKRVVCYWILLNKKAYKSSEEETIVSLLLSHVQAILQSSGVILEQHYKINSIAGEEKFLLGSYGESVDVWKRCLCEIKAKGGKRACFLQSRYYLALLFCHLYHYNLCEAQGLCDHLVGEILRRSQLSVSQMEDFSDTKYSQHELWMLTDVHTETAMAVIRSMARFMAAYFTNQLLYIFPPHNVDILHPLHIKPDTSPRIIPLQHHLVTRAVRDQNLSSVWTVVYALDLFFVGGLIPEAVWLTHRLGDWKLSVSIGVAYTLYCQNSDEFTRLKITEHHLPLSLSPVQTFQEKLQSLLGQPATSETTTEEHIKYKQFTDPIEEEDADVLYSSVQELLKAAVMADADILSETFQLLIDSVKDLSRKFCGLIPDGLYLPAPPLYCPQPASLSEEDCNDFILKTERENRQKVSGVLQRIILLFRASSCSCPAAQWYISQLKRGRKVMQKIRMKGSLPSLSPFPDTLLRYCNFRTTFCSESTSSGDHQLDDISCKILGWFRELCALCWMLHVRERLSDSCRRYQAARENANIHKDLKKNECDASTVEHCLNAAEWACRMLPFCRFMNVEELVQDIILSLLGELPPIRKVAEIFVKAFPNPEDVRVPLRDKYHSLQQRLRHCTVQGPESDKMMSVVIQALEKARMKNLRLVIRNIGPIEINVWEPAEEGADYQEQHYYDRDSLGTSISRSTLTELGNPQLHSEAETVDTLSDALLDEETRFHTPLPQRYEKVAAEKSYLRKNTVKRKYCSIYSFFIKDTQNQYSLPVVGAWEFERDDEEYVNFLELFLSYVLEKDLLKYNDHRIPFLTSFSGLLQKHELNSLFFEIHTTLKRRQAKTRSQSVFRAGSCYTVTLTSYNPETVSVHGISQNVLENPNIVQSTIQAAEPSVHNTNKELKGLFGLKRNSIYRAQSDNQEVTIASASQIVPKDNSCTLQTLTTSKYVYKTAHFPDTVPGEELAIELTGKFSNIARLLEWMIRWSDRRLLHGSKKQDSIEEGPPMIRVKTSAAAVITSLWLLEQLCKDGKQARIFCDFILFIPFLSNIEISVSHGQPSLAAVSSLSSIISSTSICAKKEDKDIRKEVTTEEKQNTSETVRHMLQDEMFKLVQLQQINFMSLMQIVQSSFVNLPNVQQTLQQYQCAHLEGIQPVLRDESNSVHTKVGNQQNVSLSLPESQSREAGFMPPSQDLHSSAPIKPFHLLAPSSDVQKAPKFIPIEKNRNYSDGFPLLKLESVYHSKPAFLHPKEVSSTFARPPPVLRVAWNSSNSLWNQQSLYQERSKSTAHVNMSRSKPEISKQIQGEEKRWAETVNKPPSKHLCSSQYEEQEISLEQQFSGNVKMDNTMITNNLSGIPLLHLNLDPVPRLPQVIKQPITTALIPVKPVTKETDCRETLQHTGISLLHANLPQQKKVLDLIIHFSKLQEFLDVLGHFSFTSTLKIHDSAFRHSQKTEKEKKEIRAWMKRKQKERMREYMKKLEEQRQKEHNPFDFKKNAVRKMLTCNIMVPFLHRIMFSEHHSMRVSQALSLVNEVLSETLMFPASERRQWSSARSPQECRKQHIVSTKGFEGTSSVLQQQPHICFYVCLHTVSLLRTWSSCSWGNFITCKRKLSEILLLWLVLFSSAAECRVSRISTTNKTKQEQQKHPGVSTAVQTEGFDHETDGDVESPWTAPDEIQGTLQDSHDTLFQDSAPHTVSFSPVSNNDTDGISESTGSFLSRLDWNAIEALVADVEDT